MKPAPRYPSTSLTTLVVILLALVWGFARLYLLRETLAPLTFVLPLLACVWTRRSWQLWGMTGIFVAMALTKSYYVVPLNLNAGSQHIYFGTTLFNILAGAVVVRLIMLMREKLEAQNLTISGQNVELEAQAEELSQQNEEIKAQSEELAQQNEEIESQVEEMERQNQELQEANHRLLSREEILQLIVRCSQNDQHRAQLLQELCSRALTIISDPAKGIALLEWDNDSQLQLRCHCSTDGFGAFPPVWPLGGSLAGVVLRENRTAYIDDLHERPDLKAPFSDGEVRSLLATPVHISGAKSGVLLALSPQVGHWTQDQFHMLEWIAAHFGLMLEAERWQDALQQRSEEMAAANRSKDQFLAALSHELRTPLSPVMISASMLEKDPRLPDDVRHDLGVIRRNVAVQSRLIDDLLDLTRIGRGKLDLDLRTLNVRRLLQETANIVAGDLDAKNQRLEMDLQVPDEFAVIGDSARLQQVFWNLLKNAIKFSPTGSTISLAAKVDERICPQLIVKVTDQGVGIASEDLEKIFLPFEQATHRLRSGMAGLGLGLSIAKTVVQLHDGVIRAVSQGEGTGATFVVELPLTVKPATGSGDGAAIAEQATSVNASEARILLVEDHPDTGELMERLLILAGYQVERAMTVSTAISHVSGKSFDLIISDLGLPDGSGLDLMRQVRAMQQDVPGICLSGYGMDSDIRASQEAGFAEHLTKPVDFTRLETVIHRLLNASREVEASNLQSR